MNPTKTDKRIAEWKAELVSLENSIARLSERLNTHAYKYKTIGEARKALARVMQAYRSKQPYWMFGMAMEGKIYAECREYLEGRLVAVKKRQCRLCEWIQTPPSFKNSFRD